MSATIPWATIGILPTREMGVGIVFLLDAFNLRAITNLLRSKIQLCSGIQSGRRYRTCWLIDCLCSVPNYHGLVASDTKLVAGSVASFLSCLEVVQLMVTAWDDTISHFSTGNAGWQIPHTTCGRRKDIGSYINQHRGNVDDSTTQAKSILIIL